MNVLAAALTLVCSLAPAALQAQSIEVIGTRAAGLGGAFVGVADDGSAAYWNPAGLAAGAYFSLVLDTGSEQAVPEDAFRGRRQSSLLLAAAMPALSFTYYRLQRTDATPHALLLPQTGSAPAVITAPLPVRVDSLVTHHVGVTLVQSIFQNVAVGSTLKVVRGIAGSASAGFVTADEALDDVELRGRGSTRFDLDLGAMATFGRLKAGLTLRNVREPEFGLGDEDRTLQLERQARAGVSYAIADNWMAAADLDLIETEDAFGARRDLAFGVEGRLTRRLTARTGLRFNIADNEGDGQRAFAFGGSFAARGSVWVDAAAILGGERGGSGWRVGARFIY